jgi:hypothetical protein
MPNGSFGLKLYRFLLKVYPASFRDEYAGSMEGELRDELAESRGTFALAKLWVRLLADLAVSIPLQFTREVFQDARHALRLWANRPGQTGFVILALAIGIGANTGVFSVVNAAWPHSEHSFRLTTAQKNFMNGGSSKARISRTPHSLSNSTSTLGQYKTRRGCIFLVPPGISSRSSAHSR